MQRGVARETRVTRSALAEGGAKQVGASNTPLAPHRRKYFLRIRTLLSQQGANEQAVNIL